jgi:hypothetical protein
LVLLKYSYVYIRSIWLRRWTEILSIDVADLNIFCCIRKLRLNIICYRRRLFENNIELFLLLIFKILLFFDNPSFKIYSVLLHLIIIIIQRIVARMMSFLVFLGHIRYLICTLVLLLNSLLRFLLLKVIIFKCRLILH